MKGKFIISIICFLLLATAFVTHIYTSAEEDKRKGHHSASEIAQNNGFEKVDNISTYHSRHTYYVVQGKNKNGEKIIGWMKKGNDNILVKKADEGLSKKEVLQLVQEVAGEKPKEIRKIMLGFDDSKQPTWDIPVWEVQFIDQQNRYTYLIVSFTDERVYKIYSIKQ